MNLHYVDSDGNPLASDRAAALTSAAEKTWTGQFGDYDVHANFHNPDGEDVTVHLYDEAGTSLTRRGGNRIDLLIGGLSDDEEASTLSHEIGHSLGAVDQYDPVTNVPYPGHSSDIMGGWGRPLPSTIQEILRFNGEQP